MQKTFYAVMALLLCMGLARSYIPVAKADVRIKSIACSNDISVISFGANSEWVYHIDFSESLREPWVKCSADILISINENPVVLVPSANLSGFYKIGSWHAGTFTSNQLALIEEVVGEFQKTNGLFPPTSSMGYQYEDVTTQPAPVLDYFNANPAATNLFNYGLLAYILPKARAGIFHTNNMYYSPDTPQDLADKSGWADLASVICNSTNDVALLCGGIPYSNRLETIRDIWGAELRYRSDFPYRTNTITSSGHDGIFGTSDDIQIVGTIP